MKTTTEVSLEIPNPTGRTDETVAYAVLLLMSLAGAAAVFLCTSRYGIGTSPDSSNYIAAARSLLSGDGFLYADGRVYTHWPPLFPVLLALLGLAGIEPMIGARVLNASAFGATIFVSGTLLLRCTASTAFALLGTLAVVLSPALLASSIMVWSEPVFVLLVTLFLFTMPRFLREKRLHLLVLVAVISALACLQRYAGVAFILAGAILIVLGTAKTSILRRCIHLVVFCGISVTPIALWLARNTSLEGHATGSHHVRLAAAGELWRTFLLAVEIPAMWIFRETSPGTARLLGAGLTVVLTAAVVLASRTKSTRRKKTGQTAMWCAIVFGLTYLGFLVVSVAGLSWNPEQRIMVPLYVIVVLLAFAALEDASGLLGKLLRHEHLGAALGIALCILWLVGARHEASRMVRRSTRDGAGGYSTSIWQDSPLMDWLRTHEMPGTYYSNAPDAVYLLTGTRTTISPHSDQGVAAYARRMVVSPPTYLVWSDSLRRDYLYDLRELLSRYETEEIAALPDGKVYRVRGEGGPGLWSVYRLWSSRTNRRFYTASKRERNGLTRSGRWVCEGPIFYAFAEEHHAAMQPVHRFWSAEKDAHLYTIKETEKDELLREHADTWTYEGAAFYVCPEGPQEGMIPVYHLRSASGGDHFYTASEREKDKVMKNPSQRWLDEGIAWYAYGPP